MQNKQLTSEERTALREQIIINTRTRALNDALELAKIRGGRSEFKPPDAEWMIAEAAKIEAYIMQDIETAKPKSGLVIQTQMPPAGAFKPGD